MEFTAEENKKLEEIGLLCGKSLEEMQQAILTAGQVDAYARELKETSIIDDKKENGGC